MRLSHLCTVRHERKPDIDGRCVIFWYAAHSTFTGEGDNHEDEKVPERSTKSSQDEARTKGR